MLLSANPSRSLARQPFLLSSSGAPLMLGWLEVWYWVGWRRDVGLVRDGLAMLSTLPSWALSWL